MQRSQNGDLTTFGHMRKVTFTTRTRQGPTWEPVRARCLHGSFVESSTVLTFAKRQHLTRKPIMGHCRYFLPSSKVDETAHVSARPCPSPRPRIVRPTRNQGLTTDRLEHDPMAKNQATTPLAPFATPKATANPENNSEQPVEAAEAVLQSAEATDILARSELRPSALQFSRNDETMPAYLALAERMDRGLALALGEAEETGHTIHANGTTALFFAPRFDPLRRRFAESADWDIPENETEEARDVGYTDLRALAATLYRAGELSERADPQAPLPSKVDPVICLDRSGLRSKSREHLKRHIARGCRLANLEGFEDGENTICVKTAVVLRDLPDWRLHIDHIRVDNPYPSDVITDDEKADHDAPESNLAGLFFRAGELAERAWVRDNFKPEEPLQQPQWFPVKDENYTLLAGLIDEAAQRVRDEEDREERQRQSAPLDPDDSEKERVWVIASALSQSLRFEERIRQDLTMDRYRELADHAKNYEFRLLCAFMYRAGQLSGWQ